MMSNYGDDKRTDRVMNDLESEVVSEVEDARAPYEPPTVTRKRSVRRVTLFSGGATAGSSVTGGG